MKNGKFWAGIIVGVILSALVGLLLLPLLGIFDTTATGKLNILDKWGETNLENSLRWRATGGMIPAEADPAEGFEHYRLMCLHCHGGPDVSGQGWASHMLPPPPRLWDEKIQQMTDGELFSIVKDGIRMTGMPAFGPIHSDEDIWNVVAFVRRFDQLTEQQKQQLQHTAGEFGHSEEEGLEH